MSRMALKAELKLTPFGLVVLEEGEVKGFLKFSDEMEESVKRYREIIEKGIIEGEVKKFLERHCGDRGVKTSNPSLAVILKNLGYNVELMREGMSIEEALVKAGVFPSIEEALDGIRKALTTLTIQRVREDMEEKDKVIIHAINAYDEYTEIINLLYERLREWYGLHFPELEKIVRKYGTYTNIVYKFGSRENINLNELIRIGLSKGLSKKLVDAARSSMGIKFDSIDLNQVRMHAKFILDAIKRREEVEKYINHVLEEYAPNLTAIVGSKIAGKLISKAGGLRRLSALPASTIQLLGAEKALFRFLRRGTKPPKHGVIFQLPVINQAPRGLRGKIARAVAAKIAIAARIDVYGSENIGDRLRKELEAKIKEIYSKHKVKKSGGKRA